MPFFDERRGLHLPTLISGHRHRLDTSALPPAPGNDRLLVRRATAIDVPEGQPEYERRASILAARAIAVSRRTRTKHALSHTTAALLHGLRIHSFPVLPELTAPSHTSTLDTADHVRHTLPLPDDDVVELHGVPVTGIDRTIIDLSRFTVPLDALVCADHALAVGSDVDRFDRPGTERRARAIQSRWWRRIDELPPRARGSRCARAVVDHALPWAESARESWLRWVLLTWGRRDAVAQCPVLTPDATYFTDLALRDGLLPDGSQRWAHLEYDGDGKSGTTEAERRTVRDAERRRERAISAPGHGVTRFDRSDGISAAEAVHRIRHALADPLGQPLEPVLDLLPRRSQLARTRWSAADPIVLDHG